MTVLLNIEYLIVLDEFSFRAEVSILPDPFPYHELDCDKGDGEE